MTAFASPFAFRTHLAPDDPSLQPLLHLAADQHLLACISTAESGMTFTLYDPESMPRSPTIWGVRERPHMPWPDYCADDGPLIA
jgi:hypothetical protein